MHPMPTGDTKSGSTPPSGVLMFMLGLHQRHNRQQHVEQCDGTRINCKTFGEKILIYYTALIQHSSESPVEKCNYQDNRCLGVDTNRVHTFTYTQALPHTALPSVGGNCRCEHQTRLQTGMTTLECFCNAKR